MAHVFAAHEASWESHAQGSQGDMWAGVTGADSAARAAVLARQGSLVLGYGDGDSAPPSSAKLLPHHAGRLQRRAAGFWTQ